MVLNIASHFALCQGQLAQALEIPLAGILCCRFVLSYTTKGKSRCTVLDFFAGIVHLVGMEAALSNQLVL